MSLIDNDSENSRMSSIDSMQSSSIISSPIDETPQHDFHHHHHHHQQHQQQQVHNESPSHSPSHHHHQSALSNQLDQPPSPDHCDSPLSTLSEDCATLSSLASSTCASLLQSATRRDTQLKSLCDQSISGEDMPTSFACSLLCALYNDNTRLGAVSPSALDLLLSSESLMRTLEAGVRTTALHGFGPHEINEPKDASLSAPSTALDALIAAVAMRGRRSTDKHIQLQPTHNKGRARTIDSI